MNPKNMSSNQTPTTDPKPNSNILNKVITFVCCLLIALALNDAIFKGKWIESIPTIIVASALFPGAMQWNFAKANKYQKVILAGIAILNLILVGYLIFKFSRR
jgi:hypothetical protein